MLDIAKCKGEGCSVKNKCYRYTAKPNPYRQAYFARAPQKTYGECHEFIKVETKKKV